MLRKTMIALAAAFSIGSALVATSADARPRGGGFHGGGFHGGGHFRGGHFRGHHFGGRHFGGHQFGGGRHFGGRHFGGGHGWHGRRHFGPRFAFYGAPFAFGAPYYAYSDYGCWRRRAVWTPYGWRWRRVYVCY